MQYREELNNFLKPINWDTVKPLILIRAKDLPSKANGSPGILLVYRDGCGHCEQFKPDYVRMYGMMKIFNEKQRSMEGDSDARKKEKRDSVYKDYKIFAIDAMDPANIDFIKEYNINGVPSIFFISPNGTIESYNKSRNPMIIWNDLMALRTPKTVYI